MCFFTVGKMFKITIKYNNFSLLARFLLGIFSELRTPKFRLKSSGAFHRLKTYLPFLSLHKFKCRTTQHQTQRTKSHFFIHVFIPAVSISFMGWIIKCTRCLICFLNENILKKFILFSKKYVLINVCTFVTSFWI